MKNRVKYLFYLAGIIVGALGGFIYWQQVGCTEHSCLITSVWYRMVPYGALMGFLLAGVAYDFYTKYRPAKNAD